MPENVVLKSKAKLNLSLRVFRPRQDGYHPIVSVFHEIDLFDTLTIQALPGTGQLHLTCNQPDIPVDSRNLVSRAVAVFAPWNTLDLNIHVDKHIPVGGGLGGGSSNAAVILTWLNRALGSPLSAQDLARQALGLGADVVFFLTGGTALVSGIGEVVQPISPAIYPRSFVLVIPPISILSALAYQAFDRMFPEVGVAPSSPIEPVFGINDLRAPVWSLFPDMADIETRLHVAGMGPVYLSGSGATLFLGATDQAHARAIANTVSEVLPECRVVIV